ncbi:hypothetical protein D3C73_968370 [compost metagenome]
MVLANRLPLLLYRGIDLRFELHDNFLHSAFHRNRDNNLYISFNNFRSEFGPNLQLALDIRMGFHIIIEGHDDFPIPIYCKASNLSLSGCKRSSYVCENFELRRQIKSECISSLVAVTVRELPIIA